MKISCFLPAKKFSLVQIYPYQRHPHESVFVISKWMPVPKSPLFHSTAKDNKIGAPAGELCYSSRAMRYNYLQETNTTRRETWRKEKLLLRSWSHWTLILTKVNMIVILKRREYLNIAWRRTTCSLKVSGRAVVNIHRRKFKTKCSSNA